MLNNWSKALGIIVLCIFAPLFISTLALYTGSKLYYLCFSCCFISFLYSAIRYQSSFSYLFLSLFMVLGFWLKFSVHTSFNFPYIGSIGNFQFNADSLDQVLLIASIGCLGIMSAFYCLKILSLIKPTTRAQTLKLIKVPEFYKKHRVSIGMGLIAAIIALALFNCYAGVVQFGLIPRTYLMWPFNAFIAFLLGIGFALMVATLLWWDLSYKKAAGLLFIFALCEPLFDSISVLSRGLFLFHIGPVLLAFLMNKRRLQIKNSVFVAVLVLSVAAFFASMTVVTELRNQNFLTEADKASNVNPLKNTLGTFKILVLDRWLGVEGVMAVASYPEKSINMLKQGLLEKPDSSKASMFQETAKSVYLDMDTHKFIFGEIPGAVAFFYYSGSYFIVFFGLFVLTVLMLLGERLIAYLTNNVYLIALFALDAANTIAQFGLIPMLLIKHYLFIFIFCGVVFCVQRQELHEDITSMHAV